MIGVWLAGTVLCLLVGLYLWGRWKAGRAETIYPPVGDFVTVDGVRLHYLRKGQGAPVVLLHGSDGSLQDYSLTILDRLTQEFDVIAFDRPGHGYSDPPLREPATPRVQARLISSALRQLGIEKPLLVGHSWSGALLMLLALEQPDLPAGLILLAPWVYPESPSILLRLPLLPLLGPLLSATLLPLLKPLLIRQSLRRAFSPAPAPGQYARMAQALWQRHPNQATVFAQENTADWPTLKSLMPRFAEIPVPLVILVGEADREVDANRHALRLHREVPQSTLWTLPGMGHELAHTCPAEVLEAIHLCRQQAETAKVLKPGQEARSNLEAAALSPSYQKARELVLRYGWNATAYQILNPAMTHWFDAEGDAVIGYVLRSHVRIVAGAPVCAEDRLAEVAATFEAEARQAGERVCWFGAAQRLQEALACCPPHTALAIGAQPVWNPQNWPAILARHKSLRGQLNRARNKGVVAEEWTQEQAAGHPGLERCLEEWLAGHGFVRLHFLTEPVTLDRLHDRRIFVAAIAEEPVGFLIATPVPDRSGWLIEQIVRGRNAPNGTAELMVDAAMSALAADDFTYVTLGLSPLSRRADTPIPGQSAWLRLLLAWVRAHGRRFYNFDGLDAFKAKFRPDTWEPLFAIANEPRFTLRTLHAMASAFTLEPFARAAARVLFAAIRQELRWLQKRDAKISGG